MNNWHRPAFMDVTGAALKSGPKGMRKSFWFTFKCPACGAEVEKSDRATKHKIMVCDGNGQRAEY
jgi:predicted RNA-binding Zn-ribbon protein involved in translation (DUF1610 family)